MLLGLLQQKIHLVVAIVTSFCCGRAWRKDAFRSIRLGAASRPIATVWGQSEMDHYWVTSGGLRNLSVALMPYYLWRQEATPLREFRVYASSR